MQQMGPEVPKGQVEAVLSTDRSRPLILVHLCDDVEAKVGNVDLGRSHANGVVCSLCRRDAASWGGVQDARCQVYHCVDLSLRRPESSLQGAVSLLDAGWWRLRLVSMTRLLVAPHARADSLELISTTSHFGRLVGPATSVGLGVRQSPLESSLSDAEVEGREDELRKTGDVSGLRSI